MAAERPAQALAGSPPLRDLVARDGLSWADFRATLRPRYAVVWGDLALIACLWLGGFALQLWLAARLGNGAALVALPFAAAWLGFWMAALACFVHEAAHHNIHPDRRWNDRLANLLLCPWILEEIGHYRALHWNHHLHLGGPGDTEVSYRNAPGARFLLEMLFGVQLLRALGRWHRGAAGAPAVPAGPWPRLRGLVLHLAVVLAAWGAGLWSAALTWVVAVVVAFPFFGAVRQLLEHRPLPEQVPGGADAALAATNRMFPEDFLSRSFGAAGFNRHLLHHWYPQASYSCFGELERFLLATELGPRIDEARARYLPTWRALARAARAGGAA